MTESKAWAEVTAPSVARGFRVRDFRGHEALSELFRFEVDLDADAGDDISFEDVLGQSATVRLLPRHAADSGDEGTRFFHGIVSSFSELGGDHASSRYRMVIVPKLWLLTRRVNCRVFQQRTVPQILGEMLKSYSPSFQLSGSYHQHNYCVQYRESDFDFVSRLMEEEGIYYYFRHDAHGHHLCIADTSNTSAPLPESGSVLFDPSAGGARSDERIFGWEKYQEIAPSSYRVWDHSFEMPDQNLEATATAPTSVQAGAVNHRLDFGKSSGLEVFEFPGSYAQRFDGVGVEGSDQKSALSKVFDQNAKTAQVRLEEQAAASLVIRGASDCRRLNPGHRFELTNHAKANGEYLLKRVEHSVRLAGSRSGAAESSSYSNQFECLPIGLPFRPARRTARPVIAGAQSATVVGPSGEEIFTDGYGRVKVQFRWDRYGANDEGSSCWVRVSQAWAGSNWGHVSIPRIGQEVLVAFLEGDPDAPIIVGSVYNAEMAPPFSLPADKTISGIKTHSRFGSESDFHGLAFDDSNGSEMIRFRSQKDMVVEAKDSHSLTAPNEQVTRIGSFRRQIVGAGFLTSSSSSGSGGEPSDSEMSDYAGSGSGGSLLASRWNSIECDNLVGIDYFSALGGVNYNVIGAEDDTFFIRYQCMTIDPFTMIASMATESTSSLTSAGGIFGSVGWTLGQQTSILYGTNLNIHRGPAYNYHPNNSYALGSNYFIALATASVTASSLALAILPVTNTGWSSSTEKDVYYSLWAAKVLGQFLVTYGESTFAKLDGAEAKAKVVKNVIKEVDQRTDSLTEALAQLEVALEVDDSGAEMVADDNFDQRLEDLDTTITQLEEAVNRLLTQASYEKTIASGDYSVTLNDGDIRLTAQRPDAAATIALYAGDDTNGGVIELTAGTSCALAAVDGASVYVGQNPDSTDYQIVKLDCSTGGDVVIGGPTTTWRLSDEDGSIGGLITQSTASASFAMTTAAFQLSYATPLSPMTARSIAIDSDSVALRYGASSAPTAEVEVSADGITLTVSLTSITLSEDEIVLSVGGGATKLTLNATSIQKIATSIQDSV